MNERIRQLAIKSGIDIRGHLTGDLILDEKPSVSDLEKFAELIVRECIDTVLDCTVEYCTRPQIVSEIKEHFGVEE